MLPDIFSQVKAIFFDLDNTLIPRDHFFCNALPDWLRINCRDVPVDHYATHIAEIVKQDNSGLNDRLEFASWVKQYYNLTSLSLLEILESFSSLIASHTKADDRVIHLLRSLKRHYKIGLISNGSGTTQRAKLLHAGLNQIFDDDTIYIEGERGYAKPSPAIFLMAKNDLEIEADKILFVGDHPVNDMIGAGSVGMRTCWVRNGHPEKELQISVDLMIGNVHELLKEQQHAAV